VRVRHRTSLAVEFAEESEHSLACLGRVGETPSCRAGVTLVGTVENPERAHQWHVPVLERPAFWWGHQGEQTHETVTLRNGEDTTRGDGLQMRYLPRDPTGRPRGSVRAGRADHATDRRERARSLPWFAFDLDYNGRPVTPTTTSKSLTLSGSSAPPPVTATSQGATSARTWRSSPARRDQSTPAGAERVPADIACASKSTRG